MGAGGSGFLRFKDVLLVESDDEVFGNKKGS